MPFSLNYVLFVLLLSLLPTPFGATPRAEVNLDNRVIQTKANQNKAKYRPGELLVKFKTGHSAARAASVHDGVRAQRIRRFGRLEHMRLAAGMDVEGMQRWYARQPGVEYAEPNYVVRKAALPNDRLFINQWGLHNAGQHINGITGLAGADINAAAAWDRHTGDAAVVVAIIDSGINHTHPDLAANIWSNPGEIAGNGVDDDGNGYIDDVRGWDFANQDASPFDDDGHGTHVASVIGAVGDNGLGISGINWRVSLMPLKVLDADGDGTISDIVAAIDYAIAKGVAVINASYSFRCGDTMVQAERDAVARARAAGVLFVAAVGNDDCDIDVQPTYPASHGFNNVIAVGASNAFDQRAQFKTGASNYGAQSVHVFAPGVNIMGAAGRQNYALGEGTSLSAPHVSGAVALLKAHRPELNLFQIREILLASARPLAALNGLAVTGARLDIGAAMDFNLAVNPPLRPSRLSALKVSDTRIDLSWLDDSTIETGYRLEHRSRPDAAFATRAMLSADQVTYLDTSVMAAEGSYNGYRMRAFNTVGESLATNEVRVLTPPLTPSDLRGTGSGADLILSWLDRSAGETGYRLERSVASGHFVEIAELPANSSTFADTSLRQGVNYRYRVRAQSEIAGFSHFSSVLTYTPSAAEQTLFASEASNTGGTLVASAKGGGGCFIATAAYGSLLHPKVSALRQFRDHYLLPYALGRTFVSAYYRFSPPVADFIARHDGLRASVRVVLWPLTWLAETIMQGRSDAA
jgi:subtilisin family serine protease